MKARLDIDSLIIEPTVQPVFKPPFDPAAAVARGGLYAPTAAAVGAPVAPVKPAAAVSAAPQHSHPEQSIAEPQLADQGEVHEPVAAEPPPEHQPVTDYTTSTAQPEQPDLAVYDANPPVDDMSPEVSAAPQYEQQLHYQAYSDAARAENYEDQQYTADTQIESPPVAYENYDYGYDAAAPAELADVIPISEDSADDPGSQQTVEYYQPQPENPVAEAQPPVPEFHVTDYPDMRGFHGSSGYGEPDMVTEPEYAADPYPQPAMSSETEPQPGLVDDTAYQAAEGEPTYATVAKQPEAVVAPQREILAEPQGESVFVPHPDAVAEQYVMVETPVESWEPAGMAETVGAVETTDDVEPPVPVADSVSDSVAADVAAAPPTDTWPTAEAESTVTEITPTTVAADEPPVPTIENLVQPSVEPKAEPVGGATVDPEAESASPAGMSATGAALITGVAAAVGGTQDTPSSTLAEAAAQSESDTGSKPPAVTEMLTVAKQQPESQDGVVHDPSVPPTVQLETSALFPMPTTREAGRLRMQLATQALCFENSTPRTKPLSVNIMVVSAAVAVILLAVLITVAKIMQMI